jgi:hypothetical protein
MNSGICGYGADMLRPIYAINTDAARVFAASGN